ncbi:MAG TPA: PPC domain-containing DNA-binding protein [Pyrinomonadaceae bacterium]|nr:PPC domain-containing DNA-binding protein [Pyrinomonadaceae bacterium]
MKAKLVNEEGARTFALVFETGDEVMSGLLDFARRENLGGAYFAGIGAFERLTFGFLDRERKDYQKIPVNEQVEALSLVGNIARYENELKIHAHVVVSKQDGTAHGGHLFEAHVRPTLELFLTELAQPLNRRMNEEAGIPLIDL